MTVADKIIIILLLIQIVLAVFGIVLYIFSYPLKKPDDMLGIIYVFLLEILPFMGIPISIALCVDCIRNIIHGKNSHAKENEDLERN